MYIMLYQMMEVKGLRFYTIVEVAELLRVNDRTVRRLIDGGKLKAVKIGTTWRISESDLNDYLEANKTGKKDDAK